MPTVSEIAKDIVTREGGFVNDRDDPGGATNHGVTIHTMRRLGLDLDRDGDVDAADVRLLSLDAAQEIFETEYFKRPGIDHLPDCVQASVFDMYVNAGSWAVKILQQVLGLFGENTKIDGEIGPATIAAASRAAAKAPGHLADAYGIARRNYYYALADRRAASRKYAKRRDGGKGGWIIRAEQYIAPRFHLSAEQHAKRVSSWG
jgi:lysozyme family protein